MYRTERIMDKVHYIPNKTEAIRAEDNAFIHDKEMDINYVLRRFFEEDHLDNPDNLFKCDPCSSKKSKGCPATKEFFVRRPPNVLIIQLKRFKSAGFSYSKNSTVIKNLEEIFLDKYVVLDGTVLLPVDETISKLTEVYKIDVRSLLNSAKLAEGELRLFPYRLYAITSHSGSLYGGQYVAYVKHGDEWYFANDVYCNQIDKAQALLAESYLLYYQRLW